MTRACEHQSELKVRGRPVRLVSEWASMLPCIVCCSVVVSHVTLQPALTATDLVHLKSTYVECSINQPYIRLS